MSSFVYRTPSILTTSLGQRTIVVTSTLSVLTFEDASVVIRPLTTTSSSRSPLLSSTLTAFIINAKFYTTLTISGPMTMTLTMA